VAEVLCARGRWWGRVVVSMCPLIAVGCGHHAWTGRLLRRRWAVVAILLWWWWSLVVSILLRRRRRLTIVVVVGWLWALVSILLWGRSTVVLLWRRVSLLRRATIAILRRWRGAVATAAVVLLAGIVGHVELQCAIEVGASSKVRAFRRRCRIAVNDGRSNARLGARSSLLQIRRERKRSSVL
jgi:hypothetical protein